MKLPQIRSYRSKDAPALCAVFFDSIRTTGLRNYTEAQVKAWAPEMPNPADFEARVNDGRMILVAVDDDDIPIAYGELEPDGHIDHLYCRSSATGMGIASALYDQMKKKACDLGMTRLRVEASEAARRLFLKKGFTEVKRQELLLRGVALHNYLMEKYLPNGN